MLNLGRYGSPQLALLSKIFALEGHLEPFESSPPSLNSFGAILMAW
jgi:hypothetical protein